MMSVILTCLSFLSAYKPPVDKSSQREARQKSLTKSDKPSSYRLRNMEWLCNCKHVTRLGLGMTKFVFIQFTASVPVHVELNNKRTKSLNKGNDSRQ